MTDPKTDLLFSRRSIRRFKPDPVSEPVIRRILEAAHAAPSAHNTRPWRFIVLRDPAVRRMLAERMAEAYARDAEADGQTPEAIRARNARSVDRISGAPLGILALMDESGLPEGAGRRMEGERLLLVQSVAAAVQNLLLGLHAEGLGGCWICAPAFCPQTVREALGLPERWIAQALIVAGHPAEEPGKPDGRMLDEVVLWR
ncbi:MAG: nitroreductase family protein [Anaerolineales bacterium]|nr:nitroreductase family protein [Anaerolineales bacterium]